MSKSWLQWKGRLRGNSEETDETMHGLVFIFNSDGAVGVGIPEASGGEVQTGVALLENSTVANEFEALL